MKHIISLGAGVQSSTMALMAAHGEISPMPDAAIFADTQSEPRAVYEWLEVLKPKLPFPVHIVTAGSLREQILTFGKNGNFGRPPFYVLNDNGTNGILGRQCTRDFKVDPIRRKVRELLGLKRGQRGPKQVAVTQWIGISLDEAIRMKESDKAYIKHRWPLIEKRMTRAHCIRWLTDHGYPTPSKSACTFCPFRRDHEWRAMRANDPEAFADAVAVDESLRKGTNVGMITGAAYLHDSRVPLAEVDLQSAEDRGQLDWISGMANECEGMCGV